MSGPSPPPPPPIPGAPPLPESPGMWRKFPAADTPMPSSIGLPFVRPKKKLKALHWDKVDTPQVTIWAAHAPTHEDKEAKYDELAKKGVLDEVERLFLAKEIKKIGTKTVKRNKKQIISSDLMRQYQIALAKFAHESPDDIVRMIIQCDSQILQNPVIMEFLGKDDLCNIPENTAKLMAPYSKDWTGPNALESPREQDPNELTREDQIYLQTAFELNHYWKARMRALMLSRTYEPEYDEVSSQLQEVTRVSESLRDSVSLMNVLGLILDIGNFMNDSNKQAVGFKLSSLARLGMVKDDKNESTFADLVERIVRNQYPEWERFQEQISGVLGVAKVNVDQLRQDAQKYILNIKNVQSSLDAGNLSDPKKFHPHDRVNQVVQRCMKEARRKAEQMQLYLDEMSKSYDDIMVFYGEDSSDENARRDFFSKLSTFLQEWRKSKEKNIEREEARRRMEQSIARKRNNNLTHAASMEFRESSPSAASSGAMDSLLEKLRAAAPQARDQRDRRRRARLRDRHQQRVASGQKLPELFEAPANDEAPAAPAGESQPEKEETRPVSREDEGQVSEADDIAAQAERMLQGLRNDSEGGSERSRRRESDRFDRSRRLRRRNVGNASGRRRNQDDEISPDTLDEAPETPTNPEHNISQANSPRVCPASPSSDPPSIFVSKSSERTEEAAPTEL
ncbi:hypothetical protein KEM54_002530 [Ascosphaera aggregata]|nr:hypothetical protein KEM54_002530 [Ascosphaera aggregata]